MSTAAPPPKVPPAKTVASDLVEPATCDAGDVICLCDIPETGLRCTRVALYDLVFEHSCVHTEPYPVCLLHKELYVWALQSQVMEKALVACRKCQPALLLGQVVGIQLLRKYRHGA